MRSEIKPTWGISELERSLEGFPRGSVEQNPPVSVGDASSIPGSGRSQEKEMAVSSQRNPVNRWVWRDTVHLAGSQESDRLSY